jgi:hypothetical protein
MPLPLMEEEEEEEEEEEVVDQNRIIIIYNTNLVLDITSGDKNRTEVIVGDKRYRRGSESDDIMYGDDIDISFKDKQTRNDEYIKGIEYNYTTYKKD